MKKFIFSICLTVAISCSFGQLPVVCDMPLIGVELDGTTHLTFDPVNLTDDVWGSPTFIDDRRVFLFTD